MNLLNILLLNKLKNKSGGITPTGTINITENGTVDVTNYASANVNVSTDTNAKVITIPKESDYVISANASITDLPEIDFSNMTSAANYFNSCFNLLNVSLKNTTNLTSAVRMFYSCYALVTAPLFDTTNVTNMSEMFSYNLKLETIPAYNTANVTNMSGMFYRSTSLKNLPALDTSSVTTMHNMFQNGGFASPLTNDSLYNLIQMCIGVSSGYTVTKTLKDVGLTNAQATTCTTFDNWSTAQSAGWSTGY